jgi:hypothetical protein
MLGTRRTTQSTVATRERNKSACELRTQGASPAPISFAFPAHTLQPAVRVALSVRYVSVVSVGRCGIIGRKEKYVPPSIVYPRLCPSLSRSPLSIPPLSFPSCPLPSRHRRTPALPNRVLRGACICRMRALRAAPSPSPSFLLSPSLPHAIPPCSPHALPTAKSPAHCRVQTAPNPYSVGTHAVSVRVESLPS